MRGRWAVLIAVAALAACSDDDMPLEDAAIRDAAPAKDAAASGDAAPAKDAAPAADASATADAAATGDAAANPLAACRAEVNGELSDNCSRCVCTACPQVVEACEDETCLQYVSCLYRCQGEVEVCAEQCEGDGGESGLTPVTERVSNFVICIGNLCPAECGVL